MKRIAIIVALILLPALANAQLHVVGKKDKIIRVEIDKKPSMLCKAGDGYLLFPQPIGYEKCMFYLGTNKEESIKSLKDMIKILDELDRTYLIYIKDAKGNTASIEKVVDNVYNLHIDSGDGPSWSYIDQEKLRKYITYITTH